MTNKKILARSLGMPEDSTDDELAAKLADKMAPQAPATPAPALSDDPQAMFEALAKKAAATLNISLSEGYSYVSKEAPTLWERATKAAML